MNGRSGNQKRWLGHKYQKKVEKAELEWKEQSERISAGEQRNLWDILQERGFIKDTAGYAVWNLIQDQSTDCFSRPEQIQELMRKKRIGAYVGIDPTGPSLHVGHLLPLMPLIWMYYHGYKAISLVGGATAKIGDPTGRLKSREKTGRAEMTANMTKIHYQLKKIWANADSQASRFGYKREWPWKRGLVNNNTWWNSLPMLEVLRRIGTAVRVGPMLSRDT